MHCLFWYRKLLLYSVTKASAGFTFVYIFLLYLLILLYMLFLYETYHLDNKLVLLYKIFCYYS